MKTTYFLLFFGFALSVSAQKMDTLVYYGPNSGTLTQDASLVLWYSGTPSDLIDKLADRRQFHELDTTVTTKGTTYVLRGVNRPMVFFEIMDLEITHDKKLSTASSSRLIIRYTLSKGRNVTSAVVGEHSQQVAEWIESNWNLPLLLHPNALVTSDSEHEQNDEAEQSE